MPENEDQTPVTEQDVVEPEAPPVDDEELKDAAPAAPAGPDDPEEKSIEDDWGFIVMRRHGTRWVKFRRITHDGLEFQLYDPKTADFVTALRAIGVQMKSNELDNSLWCNDEPLTDSAEAMALNMLEDLGLRGTDKMRRVMQQDALEHPFHPIRDYLTALEWDGTDRLGPLLASLHFHGDEAWARSMVRKWLIGCVAKVFEQAQLFMLVLDGGQGTGKSFLAQWLCPLPDFFFEGPIVPGMKDTDIAAISKWLWEVAELQSTTRRADREALKHHITMRNVTVRPPYGRYAITKPVTACYIGTINADAGFLRDSTGSRRFVIVPVDKIDWSYADLDRDQLWAQLVYLYQNGAAWDLTPEEAEQRDEANEDYQVVEPVVELFLRNYDIDPTDITGPLTATIDIITTLERDQGLTGNQTSNMMTLTSYLKSQGLRQPGKSGQIRMAIGGEQRRVKAWYGISEKTTFSLNGKGPTKATATAVEEEDELPI